MAEYTENFKLHLQKLPEIKYSHKSLQCLLKLAFSTRIYKIILCVTCKLQTFILHFSPSFHS